MRESRSSSTIHGTTSGVPTSIPMLAVSRIWTEMSLCPPMITSSALSFRVAVEVSAAFRTIKRSSTVAKWRLRSKGSSTPDRSRFFQSNTSPWRDDRRSEPIPRRPTIEVCSKMGLRILGGFLIFVLRGATWMGTLPYKTQTGGVGMSVREKKGGRLGGKSTASSALPVN